MKNEKIAEVLKYYRKKNNLSVKEVAVNLKEQCSLNIAEKTIYGWESGQSQPSADTLLWLCDLYNIEDILNVFGYTAEMKQLRLTEHEQKLILSYRSHPEMQEAVQKLLGV